MVNLSSLLGGGGGVTVKQYTGLGNGNDWGSFPAVDLSKSIAMVQPKMDETLWNSNVGLALARIYFSSTTRIQMVSAINGSNTRVRWHVIECSSWKTSYYSTVFADYVDNMSITIPAVNTSSSFIIPAGVNLAAQRSPKEIWHQIYFQSSTVVKVETAAPSHSDMTVGFFVVEQA